MAKKSKKSLVPLSIEKPKNHSIRGELVVLDENLATFFWGRYKGFKSSGEKKQTKVS